MLDLFWMLATPDAQPGDWYGWLTVYAAHALVVGGAFAAILLIIGWPQAVGLLVYAIWELAQVVLFAGAVSDSIVDLSAVALGQMLVWGGWRGRRKAMAGAGVAIAVLLAIGTMKRRR